MTSDRAWTAEHVLSSLRRAAGRSVLAILLVVGAGVTGASAAATIDAFFGSYEGKSISANGEGLSKRDLGVEISSLDRGFRLAWTTVKHRADGSAQRKSYTIDFRATRRAGVYASAMRTTKFGSRVPLDPMKGEPFVWARLHGQTLTVYALHIDDNGVYEMQVYDRTLTDAGLDLEFNRYRDGEKLRTISGSLVRTAR